MSDRNDVVTGRLVYTCNCGWVDKGHLDPNSYRPHVGAKNLWDQVQSEKPDAQQGSMKGYLVTYRQEMGLRVMSQVIARAGEERTYFVKAGLSPSEKESVALAIFMEISYAFEKMQGTLPWAWKTDDSSFSQEDLVSDLIGFYQAVRPSINYLQLCQPVSQNASLKTWDMYGAVGKHKNRTFKPAFYHCAECNTPGAFPLALQDIQPAAKGTIFFDRIDPRVESLSVPSFPFRI